LSYQIQIARGSGGKMDHWNSRSDSPNNLLGMRQHEFTIVVRSQATHPAIKELDSLSPRRDLAIQITRESADDQSHHRMPRSGISVHQSFGMAIVLRGPSFCNVRG